MKSFKQSELPDAQASWLLFSEFLGEIWRLRDEQNERIESWLCTGKLAQADAFADELDIEEDDSVPRLIDIANKEFLDAKEASAFTGIAVGTIRNWTSNGRLPPIAYRKAGRKILYMKSALRELLLANKLGVA